jgi:hypothetical protein
MVAQMDSKDRAALEKALLRHGTRNVQLAALRDLVRYGHRLTAGEARFVAAAMAADDAARAAVAARLGARP